MHSEKLPCECWAMSIMSSDFVGFKTSIICWTEVDVMRAKAHSLTHSRQLYFWERRIASAELVRDCKFPVREKLILELSQFTLLLYVCTRRTHTGLKMLNFQVYNLSFPMKTRNIRTHWRYWLCIHYHRCDYYDFVLAF